MINKILKMFDRHILYMDYLKAKSLQCSLATGKRHFIKNSEPYKLLEDIESQLEDFTGTATIVFIVGDKQ